MKKFLFWDSQLHYFSVNWFHKDLEVSGETNQELKIDRLFWSPCFPFTFPHSKIKMHVPVQGRTNKLKLIAEKTYSGKVIICGNNTVLKPYLQKLYYPYFLVYSLWPAFHPTQGMETESFPALGGDTIPPGRHNLHFIF